MDLRDESKKFRARRARVREAMGGEARIDAIHARGRLTVRERIERLLDPGSFQEVGTFARSEHSGDAETTPGDGKIGGFGTIAGRNVGVAGDDVTVKRGSSSVVGSRRLLRISEQCVSNGFPFVYFGETGGARIPDCLGAEGFSKVPLSLTSARRRRAVPMVTAIVGESFGGSSFLSAFSDLVIQVKGSCLSVTGPRVVEMATGEAIDNEALGGTSVHAKVTGQIDRVAEDEDDAIAQVKAFLSYLPDNAWSEAARTPWDGRLEDDDAICDLVPLRRTRAYDVRKVVAHLSDDGHLFEIKPDFGRSLTTALARVAGRSVGFIASNPMFFAGAITPDACDKATRFICLCDAFNLPIVFLQDVPGFMVGRKAEHERLLTKTIQFAYALGQAEVPRFTIILRKAFGLSFFSLGGSHMGSERILAWPNAEIGFMDPVVGANVLYADQLKAAPDRAARDAMVEQIAQGFRKDTNPDGAAGIMAIDEIIAPAETKRWLRAEIARVRVKVPPAGGWKPLSTWPTCF
jgi:acetyl-CoA carboxylase carboxyltransferase component